MKIVKSKSRFRFKPVCCAEQFIDGKFKKTNWLFGRWMIIVGG